LVVFWNVPFFSPRLLAITRSVEVGREALDAVKIGHF
jgi:hypothetical protein